MLETGSSAGSSIVGSRSSNKTFAESLALHLSLINFQIFHPSEFHNVVK